MCHCLSGRRIDRIHGKPVNYVGVECLEPRSRLKKRAEYAKNLYSRRKDHYRSIAEISLYGVSKDQFEYDYCAICGSKERLHIDHCHKSGDVRGLLCQNCNFGIGYLRDSITNLKTAILYLQNPPTLNKPHFQIENV